MAMTGNGNFDLSSYTPSREDRSSITKEESISILFSPQDGGAGGGIAGGVLKSQISTIPEEEMDHDFGATDQQSITANTLLINNTANTDTSLSTIGVNLLASLQQQPDKSKKKATSATLL